jgi:hypothetical protein
VNNNDKLYYDRLEKLVKYKALEIQGTLDVSRKVNDYLTTLPIDKRREAIGRDLVTWFFEVFSAEDSVWNDSFVSEYTSSYVEMLFLAAKPTKTLMSNPAFNYTIAKLMNVSWDYQTKSMQDVESGTLGKFDFIFITEFDIFHDISLIENFCEALNPGATMVVSHTNDDLRVYASDSEYTPAYELHQIVKSISGLNVYHIPTAPGHTVIIKD